MRTHWKRLRQSVAGAPSQRPDAHGDLPLSLTEPATIAAFRTIARDLRKTTPVCPIASGGVLLLDPEDVKSAFSNPALSNQPSRFSALAAKNKDKYVAASVSSNILPFLDGDRHVTLRRWASKAFFETLRRFDHQIEPIAEEHCAQVSLDTSHLLVEDIARPFVVKVIGRFIGVDMVPDEMKQFTAALFRLFAPAADARVFDETNIGLALARKNLGQALADRRADQTPCFLNQLDATFPTDLDAASKDLVIIDTALLFLADGVENVEASIAVVMMHHAQTQCQITPDTVRDAIRSDTPGQTIARIASQDMQIGNAAVTAGTPVFLSLASANDGDAHGDDFTFGRGRHKCIGETFAIAMVTAMCHHLASRQPKIDTSKLRYRGMFGHKWPRGVTISLAQPQPRPMT